MKQVKASLRFNLVSYINFSIYWLPSPYFINNSFVPFCFFVNCQQWLVF